MQPSTLTPLYIGQIIPLGSVVAIERVFSGGRDTVSLWRQSLKPETIRILMIVKARLRLARLARNELVQYDITVYGFTVHHTYTIDIRPSAIYSTACSPNLPTQHISKFREPYPSFIPVLYNTCSVTPTLYIRCRRSKIGVLICAEVCPRYLP